MPLKQKCSSDKKTLFICVYNGISCIEVYFLKFPPFLPKGVIRYRRLNAAGDSQSGGSTKTAGCLMLRKMAMSASSMGHYSVFSQL